MKYENQKLENQVMRTIKVNYGCKHGRGRERGHNGLYDSSCRSTTPL
jgi:hypothetical protein